MRTKKQSRRKEPKSKQVHFWVDPTLSQAFQSAATQIGEKITDAHRAAMKGYIDQNVEIGSVFLLDTTLAFGSERVFARIFSRGERELLVHLGGKPVRRSLRMLKGIRETGGLADEVSNFLLRSVPELENPKRMKRK